VRHQGIIRGKAKRDTEFIVNCRRALQYNFNIVIFQQCADQHGGWRLHNH